MLKQISAIGVIGLLFVPSSVSANNLEGETAGFYSLAAVAVMAPFCAVLRALTMDEDVEETGYDRRGWFLGVGGTYGRQKNIEESLLGTFQSEKVGKRFPYSNATMDPAKDELGINVRGGFRCHPRVSTELEYERMLGSFEGPALRRPSNVNDRGKIEVMLLTANAKGYLMTGRIQPYGLFGAGVLRFEFKQRNRVNARRFFRDSQAAFTLRLGGGVDLYATENIVLNVGADFIRPYGELRASELMMYNVGIQYRF